MNQIKQGSLCLFLDHFELLFALLFISQDTHLLNTCFHLLSYGTQFLFELRSLHVCSVCRNSLGYGYGRFWLLLFRFFRCFVFGYHGVLLIENVIFCLFDSMIQVVEFGGALFAYLTQGWQIC